MTRKRFSASALAMVELAALTLRVAELEAALRAARDELKRWGWGDLHYTHGNEPQEQRVVDVLAAIDRVLAAGKGATDV